MQDSVPHTRGCAETSQAPGDGFEATSDPKLAGAKGLNWKSAALVAAPAVLLLAVSASSIYATAALQKTAH